MDALPAFLLIVAAGYLAGSIPFGWLTARWLAGIDIRSAGSGNIGATNIARVLGGRWGALVLVLDCLKGLAPVLVIPLVLFGKSNPLFGHGQVVAGAATVLGHMFPVWLAFRGGKGVATSLGVVAVIAPVATGIAAGTFVVAFALSRIVSLASMAAAVAFAAAQMLLLGPRPFGPESWSVAALSLAMPAMILVRHRSNLVRIVRGQEPKFKPGGRSRAAEADDSQAADSMPTSGRERAH
ncbi:MAG: glycerol-3-phosphate 1-O-acyltransferase PlsY [Planctomycetes bacterium]|nr:glycerol-3-phosphate 1-O-acyltransferase PlsY [Planctomycetota bacterium]